MNEEHVSSFALDMLYLDALSAAERARVESHLSRCDRCRNEADAARDSREFCARNIVPRGMRPARRRSWRRWTFVGVPLLAAAIVLLVLRPRPPEFSAKGSPTFSTYLRHNGEVTRLHDGAATHEGDEIRFVAVSETLPYLLVCSIDGAGKASVYFPFDGSESGALALGSRVELPGSVILDEAPGPERVFALFSARPLPAADAVAALRAIGKDAAAIRATQRLPVAADAQVTMVFEKSQ